MGLRGLPTIAKLPNCVNKFIRWLLATFLFTSFGSSFQLGETYGNNE